MMPCQLEILHPAIPAIREPTKTPPQHVTHLSKPCTPAAHRNPPPCRKKAFHEDDPQTPPPSKTYHSGAHQDPPQHVTHLRKPCTPEARRNPPPWRKKPFHEDDPLATRNPSPSNTCRSGAHQDPPSMSPTYANPALQKPAETRHHVERNPSMTMMPCQQETLHPATPAIREPTKTPPNMSPACANPALQKPACAQPMPTRSPVPNTGCHREARHHVEGNPCMKAIFSQPETLHPAKPAIREPTCANPSLQKPTRAQPMPTRSPGPNTGCHIQTCHHVERNPSMKMIPCQPETLHPAIPAIQEPNRTPLQHVTPCPPMPTRSPSPSNTCHSGAHTPPTPPCRPEAFSYRDRTNPTALSKPCQNRSIPGKTCLAPAGLSSKQVQKKPNQVKKNPVPFLWWPPVINQPRHAGNVHENQSFRGVAGFNNPPNM